MRYLRLNTACRVTVGPFLDNLDGITPEVALTVTSEKLTFIVDDANVPTLILDAAPTASGGNNDMVHITGDDSGYYDLELTAANTNHLGRAVLSLNDVATHCPVFHEFMILPAVVYDAMILGTDLFDVSMTQILGTAVSTPATAGILDVNVKNIDNDAASASGTVTFPNATLASTANITAGTITTVTNLTNAPTAGDLTATMKTSVTTAATAATPIAASVSGAVGSVTGAVGSVTAAITLPTIPNNWIAAAGIAGDAITAAKIADGAIDAATFAANAITSTVIANDAITDAKVAADVTIASVTGAVGSVTGLTAADVAAIKAKTDSLAFSQAGLVDANVQKINDVTVTGDGSGTPWGV